MSTGSGFVLIQLSYCLCFSPEVFLHLLKVQFLPTPPVWADKWPSNTFNTKPAANIDSFSPNVSTQLSCSQLHVPFTHAGEKGRRLHEQGGMWAIATVGYCATVSSRLGQRSSAWALVGTFPCPVKAPWVFGEDSWLMTLQTLAFFSYLHYYFMFQVVLCRARGHYLCEHDGKAHTKTKRKTTESTNFITQVRAVKHTVCSCKDGAARRGKHGTGKQTDN